VAETAAPAIRLDDVSVALGGRDVVAGVTADAAPGALVAIVGPNGAGKTTLVRAIAGLVAPRTGTIRIAGDDPARGDRRRLARRLAYVPQRYDLVFPFTVYEIVALGRYAYHRGPALDDADDVAAARAAIARYGLDGLDDRPFDQLSGGEQRRVLLAQAACQGARALILDEPTAALDPSHARAVFAGLRALADDGGVAIVVTHDLNLAARHATALWVMHDGRLVARGAPADVLAGGALAEAFAIDLHVGELPGGGRFVVPA
jgi:iron complex transport system ATP-binding protein